MSIAHPNPRNLKILGRAMDSIPVEFKSADQHGVTFQLRNNTMTYYWENVVDVIVTAIPDHNFGLEFVVKLGKAEPMISPDRLVVDTRSLHAFFDAWAQS